MKIDDDSKWLQFAQRFVDPPAALPQYVDWWVIVATHKITQNVYFVTSSFDLVNDQTLAAHRNNLAALLLAGQAARIMPNFDLVIEPALHFNGKESNDE
jgi:hypothetical protein